MIKEKVKALWQLCFDDTEEYVDLYFRHRYNNEVNIAIESGEEVISALQAIPYPMTFCGTTIQTAYVSGACTHPDYRNKGVMRELLKQTFARLWQKEIPVSTLIPAEPWLFAYYDRLGYAPVFHYDKQEVNANLLTPVPGMLCNHTNQFNERHYQYLSRKLAELPACVQHTVEDYKVILESLALERDYVYVALQNDRISGLAIAWKTDKGLIVDTFLTESESAGNALLYHISKITKYRTMTILLPPAKGSVRLPLGMARIIRAEEILKLYAAAHPEVDLTFELFDKHLSANNGYYTVKDGTCRKKKEMHPAPPLRLTSGELAARMFATPQPYMNLMLNY